MNTGVGRTNCGISGRIGVWSVDADKQGSGDSIGEGEQAMGQLVLVRVDRRKIRRPGFPSTQPVFNRGAQQNRKKGKVVYVNGRLGAGGTRRGGVEDKPLQRKDR